MFSNRAIAAIAGGVFLMSAWAHAADGAVIKGRVIFKGNPAKYKRKVVNTAKDPNCKKSKKKIGTENVIINKKTDPMTLRNVLVYIKEGLGDGPFPKKTEPVVLTQFGCQYKPHLVAMQESQPLRVVNGDPTNHNIHFLPKINQEMNFSQPKQGMKKEIHLKAEEAFKVKCDVHPWMGCHIQVFKHPFFAVTHKDGTFEIPGLPAGKYVVEAWHETFGAKTVTVEVSSGETKQVDFTYEPK